MECCRKFWNSTFQRNWLNFGVILMQFRFWRNSDGLYSCEHWPPILWHQQTVTCCQRAGADTVAADMTVFFLVVPYDAAPALYVHGNKLWLHTDSTDYSWVSHGWTLVRKLCGLKSLGAGINNPQSVKQGSVNLISLEISLTSSWSAMVPHGEKFFTVWLLLQNNLKNHLKSLFFAMRL